jgi:hypothetical protein
MYIYIYIINIIHFWCLIRRPRQTQGGARQGIRLLTLVSDYDYYYFWLLIQQ